MAKYNPERPPILSVPFCNVLASQWTNQLADEVVRFLEFLLKLRPGFETKESLLHH